MAVKWVIKKAGRNILPAIQLFFLGQLFRVAAFELAKA